MLYDGREDYIRRREPKRLPLPELRAVFWLAALLVSASLLYGSIKHGQPAVPDESFEQVFSWG